MFARVMKIRWFFFALFGVGVILFLLLKNDDDTTRSDTTVTRGDVSEVVAVSGFVEAVQSVDLGFPTTGRVSEVFVSEGETVEAGDLLATLGADSLAAQRRQQQAALSSAVASQRELQNGPTSERRAVTESTIEQARTALQQTTATELQKVQNALIALRSTDLQAYSTDEEEDAAAPSVSGAYTCAEEGSYTLEVYRSSTQSGYSYRLDGLEGGIYTVSTEQPAALGDCGLLIQFSPDTSYEYTKWVIDIPNTRSTSYNTLKNAYELASEQATQNIAAARAALALAESEGDAANAAPRVEALLQANAEVIAAQAGVAAIDAQLADSSIIAPFAGTITDIAITTGEIARTEPVLTLVGNQDFSVTARIPEIDITKITLGQTATLTFDAKTSEKVQGTVSFVSPIATEIDGVGYFETTILLDNVPTWLRAGLNADIDILVAEAKDTLRLPLRFVTTTPQGSFVYIRNKNKIATTSVELGLTGNDGFVEVINLSEGATVVVPE